MSDSLLASASVAPRLERGERGRETHRAGDAVEHDVGLDVAHELLGLVGAERGVLDAELRGLRLERARFEPAGEPDDLEPVAGSPRMTSSAWVPIEPVEPRMMTRRTIPL